MRSFIIDEHHLGLEMLAVNVVERWPRSRGSQITVFNGSAVGEKVGGRNRQGGHPSGVAVKRGFTVQVTYRAVTRPSRGTYARGSATPY